MESSMFRFKLTKGKETKYEGIRGAIRLLPLGAFDYAFPKEYLDIVLNTLKFDLDDGDRYGLGKFKLSVLRRMYKCEKAPEFKKDKNLLWFDDELTANVNIVAIGIRTDGEITDPKGTRDAGWKHEAL